MGDQAGGSGVDDESEVGMPELPGTEDRADALGDRLSPASSAEPVMLTLMAT